MNIFDLEVDKGYEYKGKFYSGRGWDRFIEEEGMVDPDNIFTTMNPIVVKGIDDAKKCEIYECVIGTQKFESAEDYDKLLNVYLTVVAADFHKDIKLAQGLVQPDVMYTILRINHPLDYNQKGDSFQVISNILLMVKVQLKLAEFYEEWKTISREGDIPFSQFAKIAERWEQIVGDDSVLHCMTNIYRPKNAVLCVDFSDARARIFNIIDQINFEIGAQGRSYELEDLGPEFKEIADAAKEVAEIQDLNPENNDAWSNFIAKNKGEQWLDFTGGEDLSGGNKPKKDEDDDFTAGLEDKDFS